MLAVDLTLWFDSFFESEHVRIDTEHKTEEERGFDQGYETRCAGVQESARGRAM